MVPGELYDEVYANTDATTVESEGSDVLRVDFGSQSVWLYFTDTPIAENFNRLSKRYQKQLKPLLEKHSIPIN